MATRITRQDLDGMLSRLERNTHTHGIIEPAERLALVTGSKLNGNSYAVVLIDPRTGGHRSPFGTFHYGFTARDCYDRMHALCVALEEATYHRTERN